MKVRKTPLDESFWQYKEPQLLEPISTERAMEIACSVALKGVGAVHKNPLVGAVFVDREHRFLAAAAHLAFGQEHAEINLIDKIRQQGLEDKLEGCTLYTTLEPCSHIGKTQACVSALAHFPIKKLVFGSIDPNPLVAGRGIHFLEGKGIKCTLSPEFGEMSKHLLEIFQWGLAHKTPFVALKAALTWNAMAAYNGDKRAWITSERSRNYAHWLRKSHEAVLVGAQTVICDNPTLNIRHPQIPGSTPLRIVLDRKGRALLSRPFNEHNLLKVEPTKTMWVCEGSFWKTQEGKFALKTLEKLGVQTHLYEKDLNTFMKSLGEKNIASLFIEGGPQIWTSFLNEKLINKMYLFFAPKLFSGDAIPFSKSLLNSLELKNQIVTCLEEDLLMEAHVSEFI